MTKKRTKPKGTPALRAVRVQKLAPVAEFHPDDPRSIVWFRAAAAKLRKVHLGSRESARRLLVEIGICTPDGRLTKEYSS